MSAVLDIPVYVINLARDTDRREYMQAELSKLNIVPDFIPAVDGSRLHHSVYQRYDQHRCLRTYGVDMLPAEVGCFLSHYKLFERIVEEKLDAALILEDDIILDPAFPDIIANILKLQSLDWQVIRLTTSRPKVANPMKPKFIGKRIANILPGYSLYRLRTHVLSAGAYLINQQGAQTMVRYAHNFFIPIDHCMDRFWENGIRPLVIRPFTAHHRQELESSIGSRDPNRRKQLPLQLRIEHRFQRLEDSFRKRVFNILK